MTRRNIISLTLLLAGLASLAVCNLGIERNDGAPVPIGQLGLPPEAAEQTRQFVASLPALSIVGAASDEDNQTKRVVLDPLLLKANGGEWPFAGPQEIGDCASMAFGIAIELDEAVQIDSGADIQFRPVYRPWLYSGGRVRNGKVQLRGDGSIPSWIADHVEENGVLWADTPGLRPYNGKDATEWGSKPPPKEFEEEAKQYTVTSIAAVRSAQDACNAINAGYPIAFGSMKWGTTSIKVVAGRNIARDTTDWPHAECCTGYDGTLSGNRLFRIVNSWTPWPSVKSQMPGDHPGGYYVTWDAMDSICHEGMAFAVSGTKGFHQRDFIPDFHVIGAAGPTPTVPVSESPAMFPLSPEFQLPGTLLGIALIAVAMVVAFYRGNGIGRWAAVALLIAIIGMPSIAIAQEQSPVDFGMLVTTASGAHSAATTVRFDEAVNPMFSSLVHAAEEPMPVDFTVLTKSACEPPKPAVKPSREASRTVMPAVREPIPMATVTDYSYPMWPDHWTHPGTIRSHVLSGVHAGKLTPEQVALMTDSELEAWHSDDHEGKSHQPAKIAKTVAAAPNWGGYTRFIWTDGTTRDTPQPGTYYPTAGGVLVPASTTAANPVRSIPAYRSGGCPGGNCPVNRGSGFNLFRRG